MPDDGGTQPVLVTELPLSRVRIWPRSLCAGPEAVVIVHCRGDRYGKQVQQRRMKSDTEDMKVKS